MSRKLTQNKSSRSLSQAINDLQRDKIACQKVVNLSQYREARAYQKAYSILVVDADEVFRNAVNRSLDSDGYDVYVAADAMELSVAMERCRLDIIMLSVDIPWVNGFELCEILKGHPSTKEIPVILLGAKGEAYGPELVSQSGCDWFLGKPFENDTLTKALDELLGSKKRFHKS